MAYLDTGELPWNMDLFDGQTGKKVQTLYMIAFVYNNMCVCVCVCVCVSTLYDVCFMCVCVFTCSQGWAFRCPVIDCLFV